MGVKGKLIAEIEMKSSGHHVHDHYFIKPQNLPNVSPQHIQGFQLLDGEFGKPGSIYFWNYAVGGRSRVSKAKIESVDEVNRTISFKVIEGDCLNDYKKFEFHINTTDKEAKWIIEYEKHHEDGPHPTEYLSLALNITENIDNNHLKP